MSLYFKKAELKFSSHVNELEIIMSSTIKCSPTENDRYVLLFTLEKQTDECLSRTILNKI